MRGLLYWTSGTVFLSQDRPSTPIRAFNEASVIGQGEGEMVTFSYPGAGLRARHTAALVSYVNKNEFDKTEVEYVVDAEAKDRYGYRPVQITAFGCNSRTQARRAGLALLLAEKLESETVAFATNLAGANILPGEVINISHALKSGARVSGRIQVATINSLTLDQAVTLASGVAYTVKVIKPDMTLETRSVISSAGVHTTLSVSPNFSSVPIGIWLLESASLVAQQFRVLSVAESGSADDEAEASYSIVGTAYNPSKYDAIDREEPIEELPTSIHTNPLKVASPGAITVEESLYTTFGATAVKVRLDVGWSPSPSLNIRAYNIDYSLDGGGFIRLAQTPDLSATLYDVAPGLYVFRVSAMNALGFGSKASQTTINVSGLRRPPANVTGFYSNSVETIVTLNWDIHSDLDVIVGASLS